MLHTETLTEKAKALFPSLSNFRGDFYLAGGTGLALQIGHRVSVDFDLFSNNPIKRTLVQKLDDIFPHREKNILVNKSTELTLFIDGIKFTFLHYPFKVLKPFAAKDPLPILSVLEILATKAYSIGRRGEYKDYIDVFTALKKGAATLGGVIKLARDKFGDVFNDRLFLEQLLYLDDVENVKITMLHGDTPSKQEMINFFSEKIKEIRLKK